jgi:hypothetical protein
LLSQFFYFLKKWRATKPAPARRRIVVKEKPDDDDDAAGSTKVPAGVELAWTGLFAPWLVAAVAVGVCVVSWLATSDAVFPVPKMNVVAALSNGSVELADEFANDASIGSIV